MEKHQYAPSFSSPVGEQGLIPGLSADLEAGMATAEYAIATIAAVGFAGLLIAVLKSDAVRGMLTGIVERALSMF